MKIFQKLGPRDGLLILKKPFDAIEALQLAHALTEKWRLLQESKRTVTELELAVDQRTAELASNNVALSKAKEAAEAATRAKSEFLASMSHEVRTPMNGVIGMTSLLLDSELSDEQRHYAESICKSGEVLLSIINDILDFSKVEAGQLSFEILDFDLGEVIESCLEMLAQLAHGKGLELTAVVESNVVAQLRGDPGRLGQVLTNLVNNAIKFTEHGEVAVKVSLESQTEENVVLRFEIRDTGIGIPAEAQSRLFQPFSQGDGSTSRKYGGTGLGLAISKQLVEIMCGQIGIASTSGQGSTFWFTATFARQLGAKSRPTVRDNLADPAATDFVKKASHAPANQKLRILLAEDNIVNQEVAEGLLRKLGWRADIVANGNEVLEAVEHFPYDVVLMDCQMPELDGYETTRRIRQSERKVIKPFDRGKPIHIIAMTASAMQGDMEKCLAAGMNDYLTKPVRTADLKAALNKVDNREFSPSDAASVELVRRTTDRP